MEPAMKILTTPRMERCIGCNSCWQLRLATGFKPEKVRIPKRFTELTTWKGNTDINYLNALKSAYAEKINEMGVSKDRDE